MSAEVEKSEAPKMGERKSSRFTAGSVRDLALGDTENYDYGALCMPSIPCRKDKKTMDRFYPHDEPLPLLLCLVMGLQHAFAMVGGLITPPYVVFKFTISFMDVELQQYAIVASLIASGICTIINVIRVPIPLTEKLFGRQLYIGSGLLSVMGTSFTFLPIFEIGIRQMKADGIDGTVAYGMMVGTCMVASLLEVIFSVLPGRYIRAVFPPVVCAVTVTLIGLALTGTGMKYWGGGVVCAEMIWKQHAQVVGAVGDTVSAIPGAICTNGEVKLPYGSAEYIGLGFSVLCFLVFLEFFGSPFMKNANVIIALLFGYFIAGVSNYEGLDYVNNDKIAAAPWFDFVWTQWFGLGFYAPALIPVLVAYIVTTVETVGDVTATCEVSRLPTNGMDYSSRIQGALLSDAFCSTLAGLMTGMPNTTFSQNNGVIALTKCASRRAGIATGVVLILIGVFSKIAGIITSIPDSVLGGMTVFLFANVLTSGLSLFQAVDLKSRRLRFITAMSLAIGAGVTVWPWAFQDMRASSYTAAFWTCEDCSTAMKGLRNAVSIFLSTGYCVGSIVAIILNAILPEDPPEAEIKAGITNVDWDAVGATEEKPDDEFEDDATPESAIENVATDASDKETQKETA